MSEGGETEVEGGRARQEELIIQGSKEIVEDKLLIGCAVAQKGCVLCERHGGLGMSETQ